MVELRATRDIGKGQQVLLSYGDRPLRDFLRGYGFLPHIPHEVPRPRRPKVMTFADYSDIDSAHV